MNLPSLISFQKFRLGCTGALGLIVAVSAWTQGESQQYLFSHLAGPLGGADYVDGAGANARFNTPTAVTIDATGNLYVIDQQNYAIRKITPAGNVTTLTLVDGQGAVLRMSGLAGVAIDGSGTLYASGNDTIYKISPQGVVSTLAGASYQHIADGSFETGESQDGTGIDARFFNPAGLAIDRGGNIFVADTNNCTIRKITPGGVVTTLAGSAQQKGVTDGAGSAARFISPHGVRVDDGGNVFVADMAAIRKITPDGTVTTVAGSAAGLVGSADGVGSTAQFNVTSDVVLDGTGNLYVADSHNQTIRKIAPGGTVTTLAGAAGQIGSEDGTTAAAHFYNPSGLTIDPLDNIFVADTGNHSIRRITPAGVVTTFASTASGFGTADGVGTLARFHHPGGLAVDSIGNVYVADTDNSRIRKISPAGVVTTLAAPPTSPGGTGSALTVNQPTSIAVDKAGNVYVSSEVTGIQKITPDGIMSVVPTSSSSSFSFVDGNALAVDGAGNVYYTVNFDAINEVTPAGTVTTLAGGTPAAGADAITYVDGTGTNARFNFPEGLAVDDAGNVYVADAGNSKIRKITPQGVVTTLPVNVEIFSLFNTGGLARDSAGNLYVTNPGFCTVTKVAPEGTVSVIGGSEGMGLVGCQDGIGGTARFDFASGIAVDSAGTVYVADSNNHAIRKGVLAGAPVISTQPQSQTVSPGGSVQFSVTAGGAPAPTYQWYFNGVVINGATTSTLSLPDVRNTDAGDYTAVVTNQLGGVTSNKATLTVSASPAPAPASSSSSGGGGSIEAWFVLVLAGCYLARQKAVPRPGAKCANGRVNLVKTGLHRDRLADDRNLEGLFSQVSE
ncbi:MAG TPA: immunoglobulin domain-containing protein [Lacunisphaera sp.]|jgi:sugar lactone lactonase YvrE